MLGDLQLMLDGYGLLNDAETALPRHVGNRILMERLAALLMDIPVEEWPGLPQGFTWLVLDGDASDWSVGLSAVVDESDEVADTYDIEQARAFRNNSYVYLLIETSAAVPTDVRLDLSIASAEVGDVNISAQNGQVMVITEAGELLVEDGAVALGRAVEVRLPRTVLLVSASSWLMSFVCMIVREILPAAAQDRLSQATSSNTNGRA